MTGCTSFNDTGISWLEDGFLSPRNWGICKTASQHVHLCCLSNKVVFKHWLNWHEGAWSMWFASFVRYQKDLRMRVVSLRSSPFPNWMNFIHIHCIYIIRYLKILIHPEFASNKCVSTGSPTWLCIKAAYLTHQQIMISLLQNVAWAFYWDFQSTLYNFGIRIWGLHS